MKILIAEDEKSLRLSLEDALREAGFEVIAVSSGEEAVDRLQSAEFDLVICDLEMSGLGGREVLDFVKAHHPGTQFVLMTTHATLQSAIEILKEGAVDYLRKPFEIEQVMGVIRHVKDTQNSRNADADSHLKALTPRHFGNLLGQSPALCAVFDLTTIVSSAESTVLIHGETGTGKNTLAEAIHYNSRRSNHPFVMVSCASLSRELLESELFGQEKDAISGSHRQRKGRIELAHKGTLFLDEIDEIPPETQVKLLNFTQSGKFERVEGRDPLHSDARILAATKKDMAKLVLNGTFRQDLYYRLNVLQIHIPPLRERPEDIPLLADHFLRKYSPDQALEIPGDILGILMRHRWEGNVRELEHVVERLALLNREGKIERSSLPLNIVNGEAGLQFFDWGTASLHQYLDQIEERVLREALVRCHHNKAKAAHLLGIPLPTLKSKLGKFHLSKPHESDADSPGQKDGPHEPPE